MLRRVVIGATAACFMSGTAYAVDEDAGDPACTEQLTKTEELVHDKIESNAVSEATAEKANELLDQADMQCTEGNIADATATLATVQGLVSKP